MHEPLDHSLRGTSVRWAFYLGALLVVGPIAGALTGSLRAVDGGPDATPLVSSAPVVGLLAGLGVVALATALGMAAARVCALRVGLTTAGIVLAWGAWRTGRVDELMRTAQSGSPLWRLAAEGVVFGTLGVLIALALARVARKPVDAQPQPPLAALRTPAGWLGVVVAVVVAKAGVWVIAQEPTRGQVIAATILGVTAGAAVARVLCAALSPAGLLVAVGVAAVVGPITGVVMAGQGGALEAAYAGRLFGPALPAPLDWLAGGLIGVRLGSTWAQSAIEKRR